MSDATEPVSDSALRAARDVRVTFSRLRRRLRQVDGLEGLTPSQISVVSRLGKGERLSTSDLATAEGVRPQSMAATLAALAERDVIVRSQDPEDGRRQLVALTEAGHRQLDGSRQAREEWLSRILQDHCTEAERGTILAAMALLDALADL